MIDKVKKHKCYKCKWSKWEDYNLVFCMFPYCFKELESIRKDRGHY